MTSLPALQPPASDHLDVVDPFADPVGPRPAPESGNGDRDGGGRSPQLAVVARRPTAATYWRRRAGVLVALLAMGLLLVGIVGQVGASADLADRVDGHVVMEPGQTLWDVAVATAPAEVDAREQLVQIEELNGVRASEVDAWNVILLPAR